MKLYDAPWAPSPRRVRMFLAEKGLALPTERIDLRTDAQRSEAFLAINPRGCVPALLLDDGEVLTESSAICRYLEALNPDPPLFGGSDALAVGRIESWTRLIEAEGYQAAVQVFRDGNPALAGRPLPGHWPDLPQLSGMVDRGRAMWARFAALLERQLASSEWVAGDAFSYADIMALTTIDFARSVKLADIAAFPAIARWHAAATARPSAAA